VPARARNSAFSRSSCSDSQAELAHALRKPAHVFTQIGELNLRDGGLADAATASALPKSKRDNMPRSLRNAPRENKRLVHRGAGPSRVELTAGPCRAKVGGRRTSFPAAMRLLLALALFSASPAAVVMAAQPAELAMAMQNLRDQRSYAWEVINGDPGPVAQSQVTRRGTVTSIQQNTSPHVKGRVTSTGEMLLERDWPDGLQMTTFVSADGITVTQTPEGWMTNQEVLDAIADERSRSNQPTERLMWLSRADRPDIRRPDQDMEPFIKGPPSPRFPATPTSRGSACGQTAGSSPRPTTRNQRSTSLSS